VGHGVTGGRVAAHLVSRHTRVAVYDPSPTISARGATTVRVESAMDLASCDAVVLCHPAPHLELVQQLLAAGTSVVSISDDLDDLTALLALHDAAVGGNAALVVVRG
jgi:3-hydroxyisobutyrate dehydrogenase-like beta-hydroxyacid dehydrogenase